ncbi:MAG: tetratricopeptide repeat protein [Candidatus Sabulitectum sp.]|nr:tetratricopeptide repeat protein [Candidatus Sabulitectum sp.]
MKNRTANKKNLLVLCFPAINILLIILLCILLTSCTDQQEAVPEASSLFSEAGEAYRSGELLTCRELLIRVSDLDQENPNVWRNLGTVNLDLGFYDEAITAYRNVIALDSTRVDILIDVTGALLGAGRLTEALHTGQLAIQLNPGSGIAFNNYGMALMENGSFEDAAMCFNTALRREPENASVLYNCGRITMMAGNMEEALLFFQGSVAANPSFVQPQIEEARVLGILERHAEAEELILLVLAAAPGNTEALNILALTYSLRGRDDEAVVVLQSILLNNPGDLQSRLGLAESFYSLGDLESALENYRFFLRDVQDTVGTSHIRLRIQELEVLCD